MIECLRFKSHESGLLQGFADLYSAKMDMEFFGCSVFMKNGHRWVSLPSIPYTDSDGEKKYSSACRFRNKSNGDAFSDVAIKSIDHWCKNNSEEQEQQSNEPLPF